MTTLPVVFVRGAAGVVVEDGRLLEWSCWRMGQASDGTVLSPSERGG